MDNNTNILKTEGQRNILDQVMDIVRYFILFTTLCNMPSYLLAYFGSSVGSMSSYASSLAFVGYYFFTKNKHTLTFPFILLGILYFMFSGLQLSGTAEMEEDFIKEFLRFMIVVVCGVEVLHRTSRKDIFFILILGGLSIVVNAFVFPLANANFYPTYGRYSGFYLNPNFAGAICLIGFSLSYIMKEKYLRLGGQLLFTLAGILTLSRTFMVIWILINLVAMINNRKNIVVPGIGALVLIIVFAISSMLNLNTERFTALQSIFNEGPVQTRTLQEDSRTETWAIYSDMIAEKPLFGHGFSTFQSKQFGPGVHNSYLMVIGEAGIFPFLLMITIYILMLYKCSLVFRSHPELFYLTLVITVTLLASHQYFNSFYTVFLSMYIWIELRKIKIPEAKSPEFLSPS